MFLYILLGKTWAGPDIFSVLLSYLQIHNGRLSIKSIKHRKWLIYIEGLNWLSAVSSLTTWEVRLDRLPPSPVKYEFLFELLVKDGLSSNQFTRRAPPQCILCILSSDGPRAVNEPCDITRLDTSLVRTFLIKEIISVWRLPDVF